MIKVRRKYSNQSGLVSIMVVGIIAVLITLVVLAFSRITSRDLRQSLDRQLSSQAGYAAETGLNDTVHFIQNTLMAGSVVTDQPTCTDGLAAVYPTPATGKGAVGNTGASVTCILIQTSLSNIRVDNQTANTAKVFTITNAFELNSLLFSWTGGSVNSATSPPNFPTVAGWRSSGSTPAAGNKPAVLRVTIIPVVAQPGWNKRDDMMARARTYFLYPNFDGSYPNPGNVSYNDNGGGGGGPPPPQQNGSIVLGGCNDNNPSSAGTYTYACNAFINNLPGGNNCCAGGGGSVVPFAGPVGTPLGSLGRGANTGAVYYVVVRPVYNDTTFTVNGFLAGPNNEPTNIKGAQSLVDVTARGTDVLKRIQARVNISLSSAASQRLGDAVTPEYSIESADTICKLLLIPQDGSPVFPADNDPACAL